MNVTVLIPISCKKFFIEDSLTEVRTIHYLLRKETLIRKVLRKTGFLSPQQVLRWRVFFEASDIPVEDVEALWLPPSFFLPHPQMPFFLDLFPKLRWVYSQMTGVEHFDLKQFRDRGVYLSNSGSLSSRRVAEMGLACILDHCKHLSRHRELQLRKKWCSLPCNDLKRQTVGIIGTGSIAWELAELCQSLGIKVVGVSRSPGRFSEIAHPYARLSQLKAGICDDLGEFDHVVICLPASPETDKTFDASAIKKMKASASLINLSRGSVVDELALCKGLKNKQVGAAYIDRPSQLPPSRWSCLYKTPNLLLTHYSAANSQHVLDDACEQFIAGIKKLKRGELPNDLVT